MVGFTPSGLQFHDGTAVDADVVVFCTGFANDVRSQASGLVGPEIGELLEDYFHVDDEGEILGAWKPQGRKCLILLPLLDAYLHVHTDLRRKPANYGNRSRNLVHWRRRPFRSLLLEVCGTTNTSRLVGNTSANLQNEAGIVIGHQAVV